MKAKDLIASFFLGATEGKSGNLSIDRNILYSYKIAIAERVSLVNKQVKFTGIATSATTHKHKLAVEREAKTRGYEVIS